MSIASAMDDVYVRVVAGIVLAALLGIVAIIKSGIVRPKRPIEWYDYNRERWAAPKNSSETITSGEIQNT